MIWLGVAVLGGAGAVARVELDRAISIAVPSPFPVGTLVVNLGGALALGLLVGAGVHGDALLLAGGGLLGSYTTFSTWMLDSIWLDEENLRRAAALNLLGSVVAGLAVAAIGVGLGSLLV